MRNVSSFTRYFSILITLSRYTWILHKYSVKMNLYLNQDNESKNDFNILWATIRVSNKGPENLKTWTRTWNWSQVRFIHYQFQVFKFKTWRNQKFSSQVKFEKLQTWTRFIKIYCQINQERTQFYRESLWCVAFNLTYLFYWGNYLMP